MATERLQVILQMVTGQYQAQAAKAATSTQALGTAAKTSAAQTTAATGTMTRSMGGVASAAKGFLGIAAAGAVANFAKSAIDSASDLQESMNAINVVFGDAAEGIHAIGRESAQSFGLSQSSFNDFAVRFSAFAEQIAEKDGRSIVDIVDEMTTRVADFASVHNLSLERAAEVAQSTLAGETEVFRRFGGDVSAARVETHAFEAGIADVGTELTEQEKILSRYSLFMEQTADTAGDFANTSDDVANKQRQLSAEIENAKAAIGEELLPVWNEMLTMFRDSLPVLEDTADALTTISKFAFENPLPEGVSGRARAAADELGFWEQTLVRVGEAAARFTPGGRVIADQLSDAEQAARDVAETNEFAAESFHNMGEAASMGAKGVEPVLGMFSTLGGEMNQIPPGVGDYFRHIGDEAGTATPDIQDMAEAIRDVATARLEATDPAFAAIQAQQRADEALAEAGDVRDAVSQGEASYEDLQVAIANAADAAMEADAANATLGANADRHLRPLQDAIDYVVDQLDIAAIGANDLLDALGVINGSEVSFRIDATMDAADRALLSGIASGRLGGPSAPPSGTSPVGLARQHGGRVSQGVAYPWNEAGQELLIPDSGGYVVNHSDFRALLDAMTGTSGGGGGDFIVNIPDHGPHTNAQAIGALKAVQRRMESR